MSEINFCEEDKGVPSFIDQTLLASKLEQLASNHGSRIETLNYIFCSDDYLLEVNREHLDHDYYTDIITFPYQQGEIIESDIFISVDRVQENAKSFGTDEKTEMLRVISHGLLHLIGFKDKTEEEERTMRAEEDKSIAYILSS